MTRDAQSADAASPARDDAGQEEPPVGRFPVPDIQIHGEVTSLMIQTDARGAVLIAYTRDPQTGRIARSFIRLDLAAVDHLRRRLGVR